MASREELAYRRLVHAAKALTGVEAVSTLSDKILEDAREVLQCRACSVCLVEPETGDLLLHSTDRDMTQPVRIPAGKGIAGRVFRTRQKENTRDAESDPDHYTHPETSSRGASGPMLTIPLTDGSICHGVLQAIRPNDRLYFDEFDEEVVMAFGALIAATLTRIQTQFAAHERELEEATRHAELLFARQAQLSFMPPLEFVSGHLTIRLFQEQAADIGGDFYTYFLLSEGRVLAVVGDATGKGIPAALEAARICTLISLRSSLCTPETFASWLAELNNLLETAADKSGNFATLAAFLVDQNTRRMQVAVFGQPPPWFSNPHGVWKRLNCPVNRALGVARVSKLAIKTVPLTVGTAWLLVTDGIVEARNLQDTFFGERGVMEALCTETEADPLLRLETSWRRFTQGAKGMDDATALLLQDAQPHPATRKESDLTLEAMSEFRDFFSNWAVHCGFAANSAYLIALACDEVLTNIYLHAYDSQPGKVACQVSVSERDLHILVEHWGKPFRGAEPKEGSAGGRGLPFIRKVFSSVEFTESGSSATVHLRSSWATLEPAFDGDQ
jgi:serine phosphatase RsbU (regulator of sigma subunit)/anti-sigma regulatory factor (Ser/Thr protein kinase)